jgi:hypothetical protein
MTTNRESEPGAEAAKSSSETPRSEQQFLREVRKNMQPVADGVEGPAAEVERARQKAKRHDG